MPVQQVNFADLFTASGGANGKRFNAQGFYENAVAPAHDNDPVTLQPRGIMRRPLAQNLFVNSEAFAGSTGTTVTANAIASPSGAVDADLILEDTSAGEHYANDRNITVTSGQSYSYSTHIKAYPGSTSVFLLRSATAAVGSAVVNPVTGGISLVTGAFSNVQAEPLRDGWWRIYADVLAASTGTLVCRHQLYNGSTVYTGAVTNGVYVWGGMLNSGRKTGYVSTGASAVTRTADVIKIDGARFAQLFRQGRGTFFIRFMPWYVPVVSAQRALAVSNATQANRLLLMHNITSAGRVINTVAGVNDADISAGTLALNVPNTLAVSFESNNILLSVNGGAAVSDTANSVSTVMSQIDLGAEFDGSNPMDGWIQDVVYLPHVTPAAELPSIGARVDAWRASGYRSW